MTSPASGAEKRRKTVSFKGAEIREYGVTAGDHPCCRDGFALTLDWGYSEVAEVRPIDGASPRRTGRYRFPLPVSLADRKERLFGAADEPTPPNPSSSPLAAVPALARRRKAVSFSHAEVRVYNIAEGDHPKCRDRIPLALDWDYSREVVVRDVAGSPQPERAGKHRNPRRVRYQERRERIYGTPTSIPACITFPAPLLAAVNQPQAPAASAEEATRVEAAVTATTSTETEAAKKETTEAAPKEQGTRKVAPSPVRRSREEQRRLALESLAATCAREEEASAAEQTPKTPGRRRRRAPRRSRRKGRRRRLRPR
jgi:hypothetical protein